MDGDRGNGSDRDNDERRRDDVEGAIWVPGPNLDVAGPGALGAGGPLDSDVLEELGVRLDEPRTVFLLAVADDELVTGHRTSHWTGVAPSLEEDIAFSGISQDEINHADVFYQYLTGGDRDAVERLALGRRPDQYRHAVLCERPPGDFAYTLARQLLYDHFDTVRLDALADSAESELAGIANKLLHEERYHLEHADTWFWRIARAGGEPRERLEAALHRVFPEALWLFEPTPGEDRVVQSGVVPAPMSDLLSRWLDVVGTMLDEAELGHVMDGVTGDDGGWKVPDDLFAAPGGRHGNHSPDFDEDVWGEMTALHRAHPGARW